MADELVEDRVVTDVSAEVVDTSRRRLLKAGAVLLPYVVPTVLSFTSTPANAKPVSPSGGGDHDKGHGNDDDGHDEDNPGKSGGTNKGGGGSGSPFSPGP